ncbi:MAG TPA: hypothetical protein VIZ87_07060, partial [Terrimicrobium sp.]
RGIALKATGPTHGQADSSLSCSFGLVTKTGRFYKPANWNPITNRSIRQQLFGMPVWGGRRFALAAA